MADGHSVGATAISTYALELIGGEGLLSAPDLAGEDVSLPYVEGLTAGTMTAKGRDYVLPLMVVGTDRADFLSKSRSLISLIFNSGDTFTLNRTLGSQVASITARYVDGLTIVERSDRVGVCAPRLRLLDAEWAVSGGGTALT